MARRFMHEIDTTTGIRVAVGWLQKLAVLLKSIRISPRPRSVRLRETLALGDRRQLLLVEWESRRYLIGATPQGLAVLDSKEAEPGAERC